MQRLVLNQNAATVLNYIKKHIVDCVVSIIYLLSFRLQLEKAAEAVKSALTWEMKQALYIERAKKNGKPLPKPITAPYSKCALIRYDQRSYWVNWDSMTASLLTVNGRIKVPFTANKHAAQYICYETRSADLCFRNGHFYLHIVVSIPAPVVEPTQEVIGVDLGITRPAVTSNYFFLGERKTKEGEQRIFRLRRKLQAKGTLSAKRHLNKLRGKLFRKRENDDHVLSKRLSQSASAGGTIVFEDIAGIRGNASRKKGKGKRQLHSWSYNQLYRFTEYKAEARGIKVVKVDPRHTSQRCSRCGHTERANRKSQSLFLCKKCGYCLNADLNASKNIRDRYISSLADLGISSVGGPQITRAIVST